jgi:hypothetical protein
LLEFTTLHAAIRNHLISGEAILSAALSLMQL